MIGLKKVPVLIVCWLVFCHVTHAEEKPNVIVVTVDDLNDWIEPLGGHPDGKTPAINEFCKTAIVFRNAVCPAPVCGPSRSAILSGFMPQRTGIYDNATNMRDSVLVQSNLTLPEYFSRHGYYTLSTGKVFHSHRTANGVDYGHWAFDNYFANPLWDALDESLTTNSRTNTVNGTTSTVPKFDGKATKGLQWGPTKNPAFEKTRDFQKVSWANQFLNGSKPLQEPFFMAIGIYKPHLPWNVPQQFFDLHPMEELEAPYVNPADLSDIKRVNGRNAFKPTADYQWVKAHGLEKEAARAYLAAISEADRSLGSLFEQLDKSKYANNTIVVVMGDHGWHLGEKLRYHKKTFWAESVLTPLIIRTPATNLAATSLKREQAMYCDNPVNLIDVFPTLIDLCGIEKKQNLDGVSFNSMLKAPAIEAETLAVTVSDNGSSVLSRRWHYIENRSKGHDELLSREMYDRINDPYEERNLIDSADANIRAAIESIRAHAPQEFVQSVRIDHKFKRETKQPDATIKNTRQHLR